MKIKKNPSMKLKIMMKEKIGLLGQNPGIKLMKE
jgi:hypothetical protein